MGEPWVPPCEGVARRAYVCTKCLKAGKVQKAV